MILVMIVSLDEGVRAIVAIWPIRKRGELRRDGLARYSKCGNKSDDS